MRGFRARQSTSQTSSSPHQSSLSDVLVSSGLWLLLGWAIIIFGLLIRWNITSEAFQGRLLFPALGAINVLWAAGLLVWWSGKHRAILVLILSSVLFIMAALLPWLVIRPAYRLPESLTSIPEDARFGPISFRSGNDVIDLIGVEVPPDQSVSPGQDPVEVVLYWQAKDSINDDYLSAVHILGREANSVGFVNRFPANGMVPTSRWESGDIWRDVYHVLVAEDAQSPSRIRIKASLFDSETQRDLETFGPDGSPIDLLIVGEAKLRPDERQNLKPTNVLDTPLDEGISFLGYDLEEDEERLRIALHWQAGGTPSKSYTVFAHLINGDGEQIANADGVPVSGDYPTTLWQGGEIIIDQHLMSLPPDLPPGVYGMNIGLYDPADFSRVPRLDGEGDTISWQVELGGGE